MKKGWKYVKLGEVCEIYNGNSINAEYKKTHFQGLQSGYPFIATKDVSFEGLVDYDNGVKIPYNSDYKIAHPNSVFICAEGGSAGRKIAYVEKDVCFGNKLFCLQPNAKLKGKYVYFYLMSPTFQRQFQGQLAGLIGGVSAKKIKSFTIPLPPLSEQEEIVRYLDKAFMKIDAMKEKAEEALEEAKALFQSALTEMMTPKKGWEEKKLGEIALDMYRGSGIKRDQIRATGIPCVRYGEIYTTYDYAFDTCVSHTDEELIDSKKYFEHGDILFTITGESIEEIGKSVAYLGHEKCLLGGDLVAMKHKENPKYLSYALSTPEAIKQKGFGKTKLKVVHTNIPSLKSITIPLPPLPEQEAIVARLDAISERVKALEENYSKTVEECDAMKQAMLREVFE